MTACLWSTTSILGGKCLRLAPRRAQPDLHYQYLVNAGVLQVVAGRRVRGAVERTYVLRIAAAVIDAGEVSAMSADEHRQAFMAFVAGLLADADRYLAREDADPVRDGVGYRIAGLWLDDAEYAGMLRDLARVLQPRLANAPRKGRRRRILATVLLLGDDAPPERAPKRPRDKAGKAETDDR